MLVLEAVFGFHAKDLDSSLAVAALFGRCLEAEGEQLEEEGLAEFGRTTF